jgi:hypothetical protein
LEKTSTAKEALVVCAAALGGGPKIASAPSSHPAAAVDRGRREPAGLGMGRDVRAITSRARERGMRALFLIEIAVEIATSPYPCAKTK